MQIIIESNWQVYKNFFLKKPQLRSFHSSKLCMHRKQLALNHFNRFIIIIVRHIKKNVMQL
jgi:hypothetical protein